MEAAFFFRRTEDFIRKELAALFISCHKLHNGSVSIFRKKSAKEILVSVNIPVFNSEKTLRMALDSVASQDFENLEIVMISDASTGTDENNNSFRQITKNFFREHPIPHTVVEHSSNLGILETRRECVLKSRGKYIVSLDSDDVFESPHSISRLYEAAEKNECDILEFGARIVVRDSSARTDFLETMEKIVAPKPDQSFTGTQIVDELLVNKTFGSYLWTKMIKRSVYERALSCIPFTECTMAEDFLIFVLCCVFAEKLTLFNEIHYVYSFFNGVTNVKKIECEEDLVKWARVCSSASVYSILSMFIKDNPGCFSEESANAVRESCLANLGKLVERLHISIPDDGLKSSARKILCDYWGSDFVGKVERQWIEIRSKK